jgi:hypothetical protein
MCTPGDGLWRTERSWGDWLTPKNYLSKSPSETKFQKPKETDRLVGASVIASLFWRLRAARVDARPTRHKKPAQKSYGFLPGFCDTARRDESVN